jgi:hypothetical protein
MTAKEKAKELIDKFTIDLRPFSEYGHWDEYQGKQCALICVDEIEKQEGILLEYYNYSSEYWQEVKKEIEQL